MAGYLLKESNFYVIQKLYEMTTQAKALLFLSTKSDVIEKLKTKVFLFGVNRENVTNFLSLVKLWMLKFSMETSLKKSKKVEFYFVKGEVGIRGKKLSLLGSLNLFSRT